jgi:hypothetical protein
MATDGPDTPDLYSLVSSLYGPGATVCWYLTVLSCLASWTLHPKKRVSGSIDPDFVALLTFPTVAAGHLISQVYGFPGSNNEMIITEDPTLLKLVVAIEASLNIAETYMPICVVLFLIAIGFKCIKRALSLALTGLFCLSAEGYLFLSIPNKFHTIRSLSRPFLINFAGIFIAIVVLLIVLLAITVGLTIMFYVRRPGSTNAGDVEPEESIELESVAGPESVVGTENVAELEARLLLEINAYRPAFLDSRHANLISLLALIFLPFSALGSGFPGIFYIFSVPASGLLSWLQAAGSRLIRSIFPRTNVSIKELDQAVAILAGGTVLGFSLYSAADAWYQIWRDKAQAQTQQERQQERRLNEIIRLQRLIARLRAQMALRGQSTES